MTLLRLRLALAHGCVLRANYYNRRATQIIAGGLR